MGSLLSTAQANASAVWPLAGQLDRTVGTEPDRLRQVYDRYADADGSMSSGAFVQKLLGLHPDAEPKSARVLALARAADLDKDGVISFNDFVAFESTLRRPDALYKATFEMFKRTVDRPEHISFDDFWVAAKPLDVKSEFFDRYFGRDRRRLLSYLDFCQLLHDYAHGEQALQAFQGRDKTGSGRITSADFCQIMNTVRRHAASDFLRANLPALLQGGNGVASWVSYPFYAAFNSLLDKLETVKRAYATIGGAAVHSGIGKADFLRSVQPYARLTPLELEILFNLAELMHLGRRELSLADLERMNPGQGVQCVPTFHRRGRAVLESLYRFALGSMAGAAGATAVYPIDLVKTRMQNQRSTDGTMLYNTSFDCFRKVIRNEGILGLYRGLLPQLMGVAPEKAIKLTVNDFVRDRFTKNGRIPVWAEIFAGGCGGASQVLFTNPLEIVKIRLQVAGEVRAGRQVRLGTVLRDLGVTGLYKGASACFLRDIPFSAIYFPLYANAKTWMADKNGHNSPVSLFCAAFFAGVPAAGLCTPQDVIKTRLQVAARAGQTTYSGLFDCARKVYREEGGRAFWKGSAARILRSSPQFGVTLMMYELLQRLLRFDFADTKADYSPPRPPVSPVHVVPENVDHVGVIEAARETLLRADHLFALFLPSLGTNSPDAGHLTR